MTFILENLTLGKKIISFFIYVHGHISFKTHSVINSFNFSFIFIYAHITEEKKGISRQFSIVLYLVIFALKDATQKLKPFSFTFIKKLNIYT
jgi:hypothetical protein